MFYFYLLTASIFDSLGFHMWGYTSLHPFPFEQMTSHLVSSYPDLYYQVVYQLPNTTFSFDHFIRPPRYYVVRDDTGFSWYKISIYHLESLFKNMSLDAKKVYPLVQNNSSHSDHSTIKHIWNHSEL